MNGTPALAPGSGSAIQRRGRLARHLTPVIAGPIIAEPEVARWRDDLRLFAVTYAAGFVFFLTLLG